MSKEKHYVFKSTFNPSDRTDQVQYEPGKLMIKGGPPVVLTDEQHAKLAGFIVMDEVAPPEIPAAIVDQPGIEGVSLSTAGVSGSTPDLNNMNFNEKKALAGQLDIPGRSNKSEDELTALLREYYNSQEG